MDDLILGFGCTHVYQRGWEEGAWMMHYIGPLWRHLALLSDFVDQSESSAIQDELGTAGDDREYDPVVHGRITAALATCRSPQVAYYDIASKLVMQHLCSGFQMDGNSRQ